MIYRLSLVIISSAMYFPPFNINSVTKVVDDGSCSCNGDGDLSTGAAAGIATVISLVSFTAGIVLTSIVAHCYCTRKQIVAFQEPHQPVPVYAEVLAQSEKVEMRENIAYGPII